MAKSQADLQTKVARLLNLAAQNAALSADNAARITEMIETCFAELEEMEIAYWELASIPESVFNAFATYVAATAQAEFPSTNGDGATLFSREGALVELVRLTARKWSGRPTRAVQF